LALVCASFRTAKARCAIELGVVVMLGSGEVMVSAV
jgi:hypothetical protein